MTTDGNQVVQPTEQVPPVEPVSPKPLTEERVAQLIAEATEKAVEQAREIGRRQLQSEQDRNKALQRRTQLAEGTLSAARTRLQSLDPDVAKEMELTELRAKDQGRTSQEQEETIARQQAEFHQTFIAKQTQFVTDLGIDPKDKRIDWATDAPNYVEAMGRIQGSVAKIQKENVQTLQSGLEKRLKELESRVGKVATEANIEANSVETTTSPGVVAGSDAEFMKKFGSGELPYSKTNEERYLKLKDNY